MKNQVLSFPLRSILTAVALVAGIACFAQAGGNVKLQYSLKPGKDYKYLSVTKILQSMDAGGQTMDVNVSAYAGCTVRHAGARDGNLVLEVRMDTLAQVTESPMGGMGGPLTDAIGKSFTMVLSPAGKEVDLSGAEKVTISAGEGAQSDLSQTFQDFFPDLPDNAVNQGYKWSTVDTVKNKSTAGSSVIVVKAANTFEGFEDVAGQKCAKITSVLEGTRSSTAQAQGMDIFMSGPFTGTATVWFSPDEGSFIKHEVKTRVVGNVQISGPQEMSFPMIMDQTSVNELKK